MGYWTYHETHRGSYCCGPWCAMGLLALPLLPVLNGFFLMKDVINSNSPSAYVEITADDSEGVSTVTNDTV